MALYLLACTLSPSNRHYKLNQRISQRNVSPKHNINYSYIPRLASYTIAWSKKEGLPGGVPVAREDSARENLKSTQGDSEWYWMGLIVPRLSSDDYGTENADCINWLRAIG